jgi:hypothetical protein
MDMNMRKNIITLTALAWLAAVSTTFTACSNDLEANSTEQSASEEITVAPYPSYTAETRAVDGAPKEKDAWEKGDIIYVQVGGEGNSWATLTYDGEKWQSNDLKISKGDSYKAVYAPGYTLNDEGNLVPVTYTYNETTINRMEEYLVCEGTGKPIELEFVRDYARLRIYVGNGWNPEKFLTLSFSDGFTSNDPSGLSTFTLTPDTDGNVYVYGSWKDGTKLELGDGTKNEIEIMDATGAYSQVSGIYTINQIDDAISGESKAGKAYAIDFTNGNTWLVYDLDEVESAISDWSGFSDYTRLKVIGKWDSEKAPVLKAVLDGMGSINIDIPFTRIDLSSVTGLTAIPNSFFYSNSNVKQVDLPETITEIGNYAFGYCSSLNTLNLPDVITTFGNSAFQVCSSLTIDKLPQSTTTIDTYAFWGCTIAFSTMPNVKSIGAAAFCSCTFTSDASFEWPGAVNSISSTAFAGSTLKSITIPENVTNIGNYAFNGCKELTTIIFKGGTAPTIEQYTFYRTTPENITIYVPSGSTSSYKDNGWSNIGTIVEQQ